MAITLVADCPYCLSKNTSFTYTGSGSCCGPKIYHCAFICNHCYKMIVVEIFYKESSTTYIEDFLRGKKNWSLSLGNSNGDVYVNAIYPLYPSPKSLDYLPEKVSKNYIESQLHLNNGYYETCITVCRKTLDIATVHVLDERLAKDSAGKVLTKEELVKRPLARRIELLFENQIITKDMKDWATIIREDGNNTVHSDDDYSKDEAKELLDFTGVFLMYLYTLPKMVEEKRKTN